MALIHGLNRTLSETNTKFDLDPFKNKTKSKTNLQTELAKIIEKEQQSNSTVFTSQKIDSPPKIRQLSIPNLIINSSLNFEKLESDEIPYKINRLSDKFINYSNEIENNTFESDESKT